VRWQKKQDQLEAEVACAAARRAKRDIEFIVVGRPLLLGVVGGELELTSSDLSRQFVAELPG